MGSAVTKAYELRIAPMAESKKIPEWKLITEAKHKIDANQTVRLRAARLAREAAEPPVVTPVKKARGKAKQSA